MRRPCLRIKLSLLTEVVELGNSACLPIDRKLVGLLVIIVLASGQWARSDNEQVKRDGRAAHGRDVKSMPAVIAIRPSLHEARWHR
ncbi:hypothetical protein [Caballeronia arvi]|uniref:hypothetical protein n=1 Tax=Caballeronia arvi TaxID=1777135 RepID=UPI000772BAEE|nr:hypothetical protein [Caballeronia arvi]